MIENLKPLILSKRPLIRAYLGDCMDWMQNIPDKYYDLACVDPPYGIGITSECMGGRNTVKPDKNKSWDNNVPNKRYFNELWRVSKNQIIWGGNYFRLPPSRYFAIWDKGESMYGRDFAECEFAWISSGGTRIYKNNPNQLDRIHPTQKPVALYRWILNNYAKAGQRILDTHGGSFSSAVACYIEGFDLDICEIDKEYFDAGVKRFKKDTSQIGIFDDREL
jgi:site-specific DNA-methyltransferase (adenine-specific)